MIAAGGHSVCAPGPKEKSGVGSIKLQSFTWESTAALGSRTWGFPSLLMALLRGLLFSLLSCEPICWMYMFLAMPGAWARKKKKREETLQEAASRLAAVQIITSNLFTGFPLFSLL